MANPRSHLIASGILAAATPNAIILNNFTGAPILVKELRLLNLGAVGNQLISLNYVGGGAPTLINATVAAAAVFRENNCYIVIENNDGLQLVHSSPLAAVSYYLGGLRFV